MHRSCKSLALAVATGVAVATLVTGCEAVSKVTSCGQLVDEAVDVAGLASQGDINTLAAKGGEYAARLRESAANSTDGEAQGAMLALASDLETLGKVNTNQALSQQDTQVMSRIPADVDALTRACTNF